MKCVWVLRGKNFIYFLNKLITFINSNKNIFFHRSDTLHYESVKAAQQIIFIMGVCMLCSGLYLIMIYIEKTFNALFLKKEDPNNPTGK